MNILYNKKNWKTDFEWLMTISLPISAIIITIIKKFNNYFNLTRFMPKLGSHEQKLMTIFLVSVWIISLVHYYVSNLIKESNIFNEKSLK